MSDAGDVSGCFKTVCKTNSCDLTKSRVRLLRACGGYLCAYASLLGRRKIGLLSGKSVESVLKNRGLRLVVLFRAAVLNELVKSWHTAPPFLWYLFVVRIVILPDIVYSTTFFDFCQENIQLCCIFGTLHIFLLFGGHERGYFGKDYKKHIRFAIVFSDSRTFFPLYLLIFSKKCIKISINWE